MGEWRERGRGIGSEKELERGEKLKESSMSDNRNSQTDQPI